MQRIVQLFLWCFLSVQQTFNSSTVPVKLPLRCCGIGYKLVFFPAFKSKMLLHFFPIVLFCLYFMTINASSVLVAVV